jgi:hypothetical protein
MKAKLSDLYGVDLTGQTIPISKKNNDDVATYIVFHIIRSMKSWGMETRFEILQGKIRRKEKINSNLNEQDVTSERSI